MSTTYRTLAASVLPKSVVEWKAFLQEAVSLRPEELHVPPYFNLLYLFNRSHHSPYSYKPDYGVGRQSAVLIVLSPPKASAGAGCAYQEMCITLTKRSMNLRTHKGQMAFPGGMADDGETFEEAAQREAAEEVGISAADYTIVGPLRPLPSGQATSFVTPFVAVAHKSLEPAVVSPDEVDSVHFFHVSDLLLNSSSTHHRLSKRRSFRAPGASHFPIFFASPTQSKACPTAAPSPGVARIPEDLGLRPVLPEHFPGEMVWGLSAFMTCDLLSRMAMVLERHFPGKEELTAVRLLQPSDLVARDPENPLDYSGGDQKAGGTPAEPAPSNSA